QSITRRRTKRAPPKFSEAETCSLQCTINIPSGSCEAQRSLLMSQYVDVTVHNTIATVTLNNPAKRGALSLAAMQQLTCAFQDMRARQNIHVVVLASKGKVFSAEHDLSEVHGADEDGQREIFEACTELMLTIQNIPQPVIAKVHGLATAAGCQLVATCDLAVAAASAQFA